MLLFYFQVNLTNFSARFVLHPHVKLIHMLYSRTLFSSTIIFPIKAMKSVVFYILLTNGICNCILSFIDNFRPYDCP